MSDELMTLSKAMFPEEIPVDSSYAAPHYDLNGNADTSFTLASSAHDFRYEHGRRYHAYREGAYHFPNDDLNAENERVLHHMYLILLRNKLFLAPIQSPKRIIDLGSGTGLWAINMADEYEDATVLGIDFTPPPAVTAPHLELRVDDVTQEWTGNTHYDFVHIRSLFGAIQDWPSLYKQCFENMESGGYIEQVEIEIKPMSDDGSLPEDSVFYKLAKQSESITALTGNTYNVTETMKKLMSDAGFIEMGERRYKLPVGAWSSDPTYREVGRWMESYMRTGIQGWLMAPLTRFMQWTADEVNDLCNEMFATIDRRSEHVYYTAVVIYAKKP